MDTPLFTKTLAKKNKNQIHIFLLFSEDNIVPHLLKHKFSVPSSVQEEFQGASKQIVSVYDKKRFIVLVGLGQKNDLDKEKLDSIFNNLRIYLQNLKSTKSKLYFLPKLDSKNLEFNYLESLIFQIIRTNYHFTKYKKNKKTGKSIITMEKPSKKKVMLVKKNTAKKSQKKKMKLSLELSSEELEEKNTYHIFWNGDIVTRTKPKKKVALDLNYFSTMANSLNLVRDLGNEPANVLNPDSYVSLVRSMAKTCGWKLKILNSKQLQKLGLNSLLSVSSGSQWDGYLVEIKLAKSETKRKQICLVGKGITFDSGGISLKGSKNMAEMKTDMLGSATILGIMDYLGRTKSKQNVVGYLAIAENMPDAKATRPGDIVTAYNGKTIEILNTDAEGRLVLADALVYAQKHQNPDLLIDFATLTGQQESVSCSLFTSLMTHDKNLEMEIIKSGDRVQEKIVSFPLYSEFIKHTESNIADVKNSEFTCRAGMIQAGAFLSNFVAPQVKWAHFDIAGPSTYMDEISGVGVRLIIDLIDTIYKY
jgi:leucyl aminopeptidase